LRYLNEQTVHAKRDSQHAAIDGVSAEQQVNASTSNANSAAVAGKKAYTEVLCYEWLY
jgi:hypothetical protein